MRKMLTLAVPLTLIANTAHSADEIVVAARLQKFIDVCGPLIAPLTLTRQGKNLLERAPKEAGKRRWGIELARNETLPGCDSVTAELTGDNPLKVGYPLLVHDE